MGTSLEMLVNGARWKAGPFRYSAALRLSNVGYDSDVYYGSTVNPVPDFTLAARTDIRLFLPLTKRVVIDVSESPEYLFFGKTKRDRALNNTFRGQVHVVFDNFYVQAGGGLGNSKQRLSSELNVPVRVKGDDQAALVLWQVLKGISLAVQFRRSKYNYEDQASAVSNVSASLDRTESYVNLSAYFQQHARLRYYLDGEYGSYSFTEDVARFKNSRSYSIYGGVEFLPPEGGFEGQTSGVRGRVNLGYKNFDILDPQQKDFTGLVGNTGISIGIMKLTAVQAFFSRGPQFSVSSGLSSYLQTTYGAGLARSLTRKILFTYDFSYSRNDYPSGIIVDGGVQEKRVDQYSFHSFSVNLRLRKDLELNLTSSLGRRKSKVAPRPVSEFVFLGFEITYGYAMGGISVPAGPTIL
jgi:hypothetical protein